MNSEMQETCSSCDELRKVKQLLSSKCQIYERQIESLGKIRAENGSFLEDSKQKIAKLDQVVALLTQQIAEKITENTMLRLGIDMNNGGKVKENNGQLGGNNLPGISEYNLRQKGTNKESYSEMETSENSDDVQVIEEAEDQEPEATTDKEQTCAWIVRDDKGTSGRCGRVYQAVGDLMAHVKKDHLKADRLGNYVCSWDGCKRNGEPFKGKWVIVNHFRTHTGEKPFRCTFEGCDQAFADRGTLYNHNNNAHLKTKYPCLDPECPKVYSHKNRMMVHYKVRHTGESKGFVCPVEGCGKVFEADNALRYHWGTHRDVMPHQCTFPRCYRSFASKKSLDEHSQTHEPIAGHGCPFDGCGRKFPDARGVWQHVRTSHAGETPYVCPHGCGKAFANEKGLSRHLYVHTKKTDTDVLRVESVANGGGQAEENNGQLGENNLPDIDKFLEIKMHIPNSESSDDIQICAWIVSDGNGTSGCCGRAFPAVGDLVDHLKEDHLKADRHGNYVCWWDGCKRNGVPFQSRTGIVSHLRVHSFRCAFEGCAQTFADVDTLRMHSDTHSSQDPECPKVFLGERSETGEDILREKKASKDQDAESYSEMEDTVIEEADDQGTEATMDHEQLQTCGWIVRDGKGTSGRCGRVFPFLGDLVNHFKKDHLNADRHGNYVCAWDGCKRNGEPFQSRTGIISHFRVHSFRCPFEGCSETFGDLDTLRMHSDTHSRTAYPSPDPECPKVFLGEHPETHEPVARPVRATRTVETPYVCPHEDNLREEETNKDEDVGSCSEMEDSGNSDDVQMLQTCAWIVRDDKGTSGVCGRVFPGVGDLVAHFRKDHRNADSHGNYVCSWDGCKRNGEPFKSRTIIDNHFRTHSDARPFRCPFEGCGRAFTQSSALSQHKSSHSKTAYPCLDPGCPKVFTHKTHMMLHYRVRHTGERKGFPCPEEGCGKVFEFNHVLRKHFVSHRPYQCRFPRCFQSFASKQSLDEHSVAHEPVAGGHECPFDGCGRKFPDARGVREHVRATHTGETPYVCPYECGKAFGRERALKRHMNVHTKNTDTVESP